jgi:hypothetical protein
MIVTLSRKNIFWNSKGFSFLCRPMNNLQSNIMNKSIFTTFFVLLVVAASSQVNPVITQWMQNTDGILGRHYMSGNSTPIVDNVQANVQLVQYSNNWAYITTNGIPAYVTGPFLDGNPSLAQDQNAIFKFPLVPSENTGVPTSTNGGNIGVFVNGVALFDYRDGVSWRAASSSLAGGPIPGPPGDGVWNRDAVVAERMGFDCAKGHPAMGNYHHHQNPSAFNLDLTVISDVCDLYLADGLYVINDQQHSPLIGFAYDGFPIYGAYGYLNADGTGGVVRMKSSYVLRNISTRTFYADGTNVADGPDVSDTYPLGLFREDYEYIPTSPASPDFLDEHNGRFCVTPEYPEGSYCYFTTVDENWNSAYPYAVGPTFFGNKVAAKVNSIAESVTTYDATIEVSNLELNEIQMTVFPNPASDIIGLQLADIVRNNYDVKLFDMKGNLIQNAVVYQGSTITFLDARSLYNGEYLIVIYFNENSISRKVVVSK